MTKHRQGAASVISMRFRQWEEAGVLQNKKMGSLLLPSRNIIIGRQGSTRRSGSGPYRVNRGRKTAREKETRANKPEIQPKKAREGGPRRGLMPQAAGHTRYGDTQKHMLSHCSMQWQKGTAHEDREDGRKRRPTGRALVIFQLWLRWNLIIRQRDVRIG